MVKLFLSRHAPRPSIGFFARNVALQPAMSNAVRHETTAGLGQPCWPVWPLAERLRLASISQEPERPEAKARAP